MGHGCNKRGQGRKKRELFKSDVKLIDFSSTSNKIDPEVVKALREADQNFQLIRTQMDSDRDQILELRAATDLLTRTKLESNQAMKNIQMINLGNEMKMMLDEVKRHNQQLCPSRYFLQALLNNHM